MYRSRTVIIFVILFGIYLTLVIIIKSYIHKHADDHTTAAHIQHKKDENIEIQDHSLNVVREKLLNQSLSVEIWGKASISLYLWQHILKGTINTLDNGFIRLGNLTANNMQITFRNGPGIAPSTVPIDIQYLIIVLNGRTIERVKEAKKWLVFTRNLLSLKSLIVVLLGNEECDNDWILPYMISRGGNIDAVFFTYDSPLVDEFEFFQWPLGVAEYRGFPDFSENYIDLLNKRPFVANFVGTVYKGSSREYLVNLIEKNKLTNKVHLSYRNEWIPNETQQSRSRYVEVLQMSDLTLSPVGMNTECYRVYEAMSLGSVPVVENVVTPGRCARDPPAPLRLLKHLHAPVIWLSHWDQLPNILRQEQTLTFKDVIKRRKNIIRWYSAFKRKMKNKFLKVILKKFLS